jgi:hypothetical protein
MSNPSRTGFDNTHPLNVNMMLEGETPISALRNVRDALAVISRVTFLGCFDEVGEADAQLPKDVMRGLFMLTDMADQTLAAASEYLINKP